MGGFSCNFDPGGGDFELPGCQISTLSPPLPLWGVVGIGALRASAVTVVLPLEPVCGQGYTVHFKQSYLLPSWTRLIRVLNHSGSSALPLSSLLLALGYLDYDSSLRARRSFPSELSLLALLLPSRPSGCLSRSSLMRAVRTVPSRALLPPCLASS